MFFIHKQVGEELLFRVLGPAWTVTLLPLPRFSITPSMISVLIGLRLLCESLI